MTTKELMPKKLIIDPRKINQARLSAIEMRALNEFFKSNLADNVWDMNQQYEYSYQDVKYRFCFTHTLLRRKRKEGRSGDRFEILASDEEPIGKGGYSIVYPLLGTIKFDADTPILKTGKKRVVKVEHHDKEDYTVRVVQEYNNLADVGHLGVKPPVFATTQEGKISLLVMKQAEGFTLETILHPAKRLKILKQIPELTVAKRFEITMAILNAVKTQVIDNGMVHRDLKPGNIMIDLNQSPPKVTIIDYANAIKGELQQNRRVGTTAYRAPEIYQNAPLYTVKADSYAVGRILSYLWGDLYENYYMQPLIPWNQIKTKATNKDLFSDPEVNLFKKDRIKIRKCLSGLLKEDPSERSTVDKAMNQFLKIDSRKYQLKKIQLLSKCELNEYEETLKGHIKSIFTLLANLSEKAKNLRDRGFHDVAEKAETLVQQLTARTNVLAKNPDPALFRDYRHACFKDIDPCRKDLQGNRNLRWLIGEIAAAVSLLVVGYVLAISINYQATGRLGLFSQTETDQIAEEIRDTIYQVTA